jgi:uncharacterized protein GlcG (DUF336 family)
VAAAEAEAEAKKIVAKGGVPIVIAGKLIGSSAQDDQIAKAGAAALAN